MHRQIPLHCCQTIPEQWKTQAKEATSEEQLARPDWMNDENYRVNVDTTGLISAAMHAFNTDDVPTITLKTAGRFNHIFCIQFANEFRVCARVPKPGTPRDRNIEAVVAMMTMARLVRRCPVPEIYAWHADHENPVRAPYMLLEWVETPNSWEKWNSLPSRDLDRLLHELASQQANFAYPLHFSGFGSIYFAKTLPKNDTQVDLGSPSAYELGSLSLGPQCTMYRGIDTWPENTPSSLRDLWKGLWQHEVDSLKKIHGSDTSTIIATDEHPSPLIRTSYTMGEFLDAANNLLVLIDSCNLPPRPQLYNPCFVSADYRISNVKINPQTLKVSAFMDWEEVYVMPFLLCSRFPEEICVSTGADEEWQKLGAFTFLPVSEMEEGEEDSDSDSDRDEIFGSKADSDEDTDSESSESEASEAPRTPTPEDSHRPERIRATKLRQKYAGYLMSYDSRYDYDGFWQIRQEPLIIQHLVTHGWIEWLLKGEWLKERAKQ